MEHCCIALLYVIPMGIFDCVIDCFLIFGVALSVVCVLLIAF